MYDVIITAQDLELEYEIDEQTAFNEVRDYIKTHSGISVPSIPISSSDTLFTKKITIRIPYNVLSEIKNKSLQMGLPYQTFMNLILSEYVAGRLNFNPT